MRKITAAEAFPFIGWCRGADRVWRKAAEAHTEADCLARLLLLHRGEAHVDRVVLPEGISPCRKPLATAVATAAPAGQRTGPRERYDLSEVGGTWSGWKKETSRSGWELVVVGTLAQVRAKLKEIHESVRDTKITLGQRKPSYRRSG